MLNPSDIDALEQDQLYYDAQEAARKELARILAEAPHDSNTNGKVAIYSYGCCWWTSSRHNAGSRLDFGGKTDLPCCPFCGSVLLEVELGSFIATARQNPSHYGEWELWTFARAHARQCFTRWSQYPAPHRQAIHITPMRFG